MDANGTLVAALTQTIRNAYYDAGDAYESGKWEKGSAALGAHFAAAELARNLGVAAEVEKEVRFRIGFDLYTLPQNLATLLANA